MVNDNRGEEKESGEREEGGKREKVWGKGKISKSTVSRKKDRHF